MPPSTRRIAEAVGVKQASLYYHFASKQDILAELLADTVRPSLAFSARLARTDELLHVQLFALTVFDVNLPAVFKVLERRSAVHPAGATGCAGLEDFRRDRELLKRAYGRRVVAGAKAGTFDIHSADVATSLPAALAESVISMRADGARLADDLGHTIAASVLRLLGCSPQRIARAAAEAPQLLSGAKPVERQV